MSTYRLLYTMYIEGAGQDMLAFIYVRGKIC
jgi:hypothetical protein